MELIYLYLGNINRPLKNQEINFGNKFCVHYDPETRNLTIFSQANAKPYIYGEHIKSLDLLVGQNGTGKSTILDLLGLPPRSRREFLPLSEENDQSFANKNLNPWFVLYHTKDNQFAVEGYHANTLAFLVEGELGWHPFYSAAFRYDVETQRASQVKYLQFCRDYEQNKRYFYSELFYVLYEPESSKVSWYNKPYRAPESDICVDHICPRIYAGRNGYTAITKYLYDAVHNHEFASKMASKPGTTITIEIFQKDKAEFVSFEDKTVDNPLDRSSSGRKIASVKLYHKQDMTLIDSFQLLPPPLGSEADNRFSAKERMVLIYLEEIVCYFILQAGITPPAYQGEDTYSSRKQHLMNVLESVEQTDFHLAKEIIAGIEAIPNRYFENNRVRATIPLQEMSENFLIALAQGLDESLLENHEINHRYFVRMSFVGISTGEAQYIDLYATLYHAIKSSNHPKGDTCVLLLDEPDCGFHPEWSRNFILNLTELLNADVFRNYNYQVIITTHSPFLVSDVPKESVHCLHRDKDGSISIKSSQHGLLSNLNDLITDSFFADSIFGAFAEQYANKLISDIAVAEVQPEFVPEDQLAELRSRLDRIEDRVIWQSLNWKLCRLEARAR